MHQTVIELKNGTRLCGTLWDWCPVQGCFSIADDASGANVRVYLSDVISAVTKLDRRTVELAGQDVDVLQRAREDGWRPPVPRGVK